MKHMRRPMPSLLLYGIRKAQAHAMENAKAGNKDIAEEFEKIQDVNTVL